MEYKCKKKIKTQNEQNKLICPFDYRSEIKSEYLISRELIAIYNVQDKMLKMRRYGEYT